jgi:signal transduction histidine kinase
MARGLHPVRLEHLGLAAAIRGACADMSTVLGAPITFEPQDIPQHVPRAVALCLYRVTQEALNNVAKHAGAALVHVHLTGRARALDTSIRLAVRDDGCGFSVQARSRTGSLGIASMRERVRGVGGTLIITSTPGRGTQIDVEVPLLPEMFGRSIRAHHGGVQ